MSHKIHAVDFDKTLATYEGGHRIPGTIGEPIAPMVDRIKAWLADGDTVKIFTARVTPGNPNAGREKIAIKRFCKEQFGVDMEVTATKEPDFSDIWDDRAVSVEPNTGRVLTVFPDRETTNFQEISNSDSSHPDEQVFTKTEQSSGKTEQSKNLGQLKPLNEITAMVVDHGLFVETALRLARDYKKVYYCCPNVSPFPKMNVSYIGYGMEGIALCDSIFGPHFDSVDLFVFPDLGFGPEQAYLEGIGKAVWGARMGEEMETERVAMKKAMAKLGLPVGPYSVIVGISRLREYLKTHENVYVKISRYRGEFESFKSENYKIIEPKIDKLENELGALKNIAEFIVEDELPDKVEIGYDAYTVDGAFPKNILAGIEVKDKAYVGAFRPYKDFPAAIATINAAIAPLLKSYGYRGQMSTEIRVGKDKKPYLIDMCCRQPNPPGVLCLEMYSNFPDIVLQGAHGKPIDPVPSGKFGVQVTISSEFAFDGYQPIYFDEKYRQYVKLHNACKIEGVYYIIPQEYGLKEIGSVIGYGDTLEAAIAMCKKVAETVHGFKVEVLTGALDDAEAELEKSEKMGVEML
jgi:hypothetical protein